MAAKNELPESNLYAADTYNSNPLFEAAFVIFPKRDGLLVHKKSGTAWQPTWRGMSAASALLVLEEELKEILAQKDDDGSAVWGLNPNERPFDPAKLQRMQEAEAPAKPASNVTQFQQPSGATRPRNELNDHFDEPAVIPPDAKHSFEEGGMPVEGERYRDIVALKRVQETSKKDASKTYEYWVPYYADDKGDPKSIGRIMSWGQVADQLRAVVPAGERGNNDNGSKVFNKIIELSQPFRIFYTLKDIGNGRSASEFHRIEPLGAA